MFKLPRHVNSLNELGLNEGDFLQADGTYREQELADKPVEFLLLREAAYDRRLLPFVPAR